MMNQTLVPNTREVAAKVMDGEAVLINLSSGVYYSAVGCGGVLWEFLEHGLTPKECVEELVQRYQVEHEEATEDVTKFCKQLLEEKLVTAEQGEKKALTPPDEQKLTYQSPALEVYRDMGDLLALDPPAPDLDLAT